MKEVINMNKKGQEGGVLSVIRTAILVIIVIFVLIFIFTRLIGKEGKEIVGHIDSLGDCDFDGIANLYDKCACTPGDEKSDGCPDESKLNDYKENKNNIKSTCEGKMGEYYKQKEEERTGSCAI